MRSYLEKVNSVHVAALIILVLLLSYGLLLPVAAQSNPADIACQGISATGADCAADAQGEVSSTIKSLVEVLLFAVGVAAVIMMVIGGLRFITSGGDTQATANARNTVLYSAVGLIVAVLSYTLVQYVFNAVNSTAT